MQVVTLCPRHTHRVTLDGALHLELAAFDGLLDLLAVFGADAVAHLHHLLDLVATDLLDLAHIEETCVHAAFGQFAAQHVVNLLELEISVAVQDDFLVLELDGRARALEIKAGSDFARNLIDRIFHFDEIGFKNGVKRGHAGGLAKR
ncbi:hypothetical protein D9M68_824970 [compost metagenome]